ncbi:hypothetical protein BKA62DRAFT_614354 [Auriculariales sp. MPI-PUGE-AT-0066]|nr:hypothetical protein BKA62DRAFT_614354 [Auriculariales sp. MPI-PUGE-AT-0066]
MKFATLSHVVAIFRGVPAPEPKRSKKQRRAVSDPGTSPSPAASTSKSPAILTRPSSPSASLAIVSSSGISPQTHPCLLPPAPVEQPQEGIDRRAIMEQRDEFICDPHGGVNAQRLLALTRREMLSKASTIGAHALVDEQWSVSIIRPKRLGRAARTRITYAAVAARSTHGTDPQMPVALSQAKGLPGLMTVIERL